MLSQACVHCVNPRGTSDAKPKSHFCATLKASTRVPFGGTTVKALFSVSPSPCLGSLWILDSHQCCWQFLYHQTYFVMIKHANRICPQFSLLLREGAANKHNAICLCRPLAARWLARACKGMWLIWYCQRGQLGIEQTTLTQGTAAKPRRRKGQVFRFWLNETQQ